MKDIHAEIVLIETSWNVKKIKGIREPDSRPGINRNIVECKVVSFRHKPVTETVLIETSWNVKTDSETIPQITDWY